MELIDDVTPTRLFSAFGLITGLLPSRFRIDNAPPKFTIPSATEKIVLDLLASQSTKYEFTLLQNKTENNRRPIEQVKYLQTYKSILKSALPEIVSSYNIFKSSYEMSAFLQEFSYTPIITDISQDTVYFNVSIKRNGSLYGIVMELNSSVPDGRQMRYGLNSNNFYLDANHFMNLSFSYPSSNRGKSFIYKIGNFSNLYDNTDYVAYFIAENDLPVNPDLMDDSLIQKVSFRTLSEIFVIPDNYKASDSDILKNHWIVIGLIIFILISILG